MKWSDEREQFFKNAYAETSAILIRIAYRITFNMEVAEELCHEAFIKLCERPERIPNQNQIKYWLIRVVKNMALNHAKRQKRERWAYEKVLNGDTRSAESGEDIFLKQETSLSVQQAVNTLPQKLQEVLVLVEYGRLNYREIGKVLKISEANVKMRVFRAREKMSNLLKKDGLHALE
ncbi:MAG: RNA polymerase sigma factor [Salinispira sp.]